MEPGADPFTGLYGACGGWPDRFGRGACRCKTWFRAKFFQQYLLFYRFNSGSKVIVVVWVNNDKTLRTYGSKKDVYATFKGMLEDGNPPDNFDALLGEAAAANKRFSSRLSVDLDWPN
ncbi:type II toxin-antitoxin system YhaV family toxin [Roseibium sp.]|uniref:type II toxin-antitoxin system YhaV family toxin n=1 Tax=Roseibium sp. TaxID=1936156 RepID=UPI003BAA3E69